MFIFRGSLSQMFFKIGAVKNFAKSTRNTCIRVFFNKVAGDADKIFSCEFCEICKNTFFDRQPPVAASVFNSFMTEAVII